VNILHVNADPALQSHKTWWKQFQRRETDNSKPQDEVALVAFILMWCS